MRSTLRRGPPAGPERCGRGEGLGNLASNGIPGRPPVAYVTYLTFSADVSYASLVIERHYPSYTAARTHLREVLDVARSGRVATVTREHDRFAVVDANLLRSQIEMLSPSGAVVAAEGGGWAAYVPGLPVSGEGATFDAAIDDLIDALRDYATDWNDRLLNAPNHRDHFLLVLLVELSNDAELKDWLLREDLAAAAG